MNSVELFKWFRSIVEAKSIEMFFNQQVKGQLADTYPPHFIEDWVNSSNINNPVNRHPLLLPRPPMAYDENSSVSSQMQMFSEIDGMYRCTLCPYRSFTQENLNKHIRKHSEQKLYPCSHCEKCFSTQWNLKTHLRTHSGDKPFQCDLCPYKGGQKTHLQVHLTNKHPRQCIYMCKNCLVRLDSEVELQNHMIEAHG